MDGITILKVIASLIMSYILYSNFRFYLKNKKLVSYITKAPALSSSVKEGDYVQFQGKLTLPETHTPFTQLKCSYWSVIVKAEFQSKKKKPAKGMQTHRPVIYKENADDLPLLVTNKIHTVQLGFMNNVDVIFNLNKNESTVKKPPNEEIAKLAKPKYNKYIIEEYWLAENSQITLWGTVESINKNCITLAGFKNEKQPPMAFHGMAKTLTNTLKRKSGSALLLSLVILFSITALWFWLPKRLDEFYLGMTAIITVIILFIMKYRIAKPPF